MGKVPAPAQNESSIGAVATIEERIERELKGKVLERDIPSVASRITKIAVSEQFSGPMPHPKHLREYDQILPGAAERILSMAERNLDHNMQSNRTALEAEIDDRKRGMYFGFFSLVFLIGGGFGSLFVTDNPIVPGIFLGTAALGAVGMFVRGRSG